MNLCKKYPVPSADIIILYYDKNTFQGIVLIKRKFNPKGLALPGGIMEIGETAEETARRESKEETGLNIKVIKLLGIYSDPKRDKRWHSISAVFLAKASGKFSGGDDAAKAIICPLNKIPKLCFDHNRILKEHIKEIKNLI